MRETTIAVIGLGRMGMSYLRMLRKHGFPAHDIVVWDIRPDRIAAALSEFEGIIAATSLLDFAESARWFIVAVSTPSHYPVIEVLARSGARKVLCEKPLVPTVELLQHVRAVAEECDTNVLTALICGFADTRGRLMALRDEHELVLREGTAVWGKNRVGDSRPTPGDLTDEFIHPLDELLSLTKGITRVGVSAHSGFLRYVDRAVQEAAFQLDNSFPMDPDSSTGGLIRAFTSSGAEMHATIASSFTMATQVREVRGTFTRVGSDDAAFGFVAGYDINGTDPLQIWDLQANKLIYDAAPSTDKLYELTGAFLRLVHEGVEDPRLGPLPWSALLTGILDAIRKSSKNDSSREYVRYQEALPVPPWRSALGWWRR